MAHCLRLTGMAGEALAIFLWASEFIDLAVITLEGGEQERGSAFVPSLRRVPLLEAAETMSGLSYGRMEATPEQQMQYRGALEGVLDSVGEHPLVESGLTQVWEEVAYYRRCACVCVHVCACVRVGVRLCRRAVYTHLCQRAA